MYEIPRTLVTALLDEFVVPFVGAGVSRAVCNHAGQPLFPGWSELLGKAAKRLRDDGKRFESDVVEGLLYKTHPDFLAAAQYARQGLGAEWYRLLKVNFDPRQDCAADGSLALARAIWKLPSQLVVTTNYDQVLRWANDKPHDVVPLNIEPTAELANMLRSRLERPTVWHLHGHIHEATNLILTPDGYRTLYPDKQGPDVHFNAALQSLRHLLAARTFLFIGFSMEDERFGDQIEWVDNAFAGAAGPHYLLVRECDLRTTQQRLKRFESIECLPFENYGPKLVERIEELAMAGRHTHRTDLSSDPPVVPPRVPRTALVSATPSVTSASGQRDPLLDVRLSYRRVHEFQRRLFDRLTELSDALQRLEMEFERWDPNHYSRPARSTTEFFRRPYWAWDFLPGFAVCLSWQSASAKGGGARRVVVEVESDTGFRSGLNREPEIADFASANEVGSAIRVGLFRSTDPSGPWSQAWQLLTKLAADQLYDSTDHTVQAGGGDCTYRHMSIRLSDVMESVGLEAKLLVPIGAWFGGHV